MIYIRQKKIPARRWGIHKRGVDKHEENMGRSSQALQKAMCFKISSLGIAG